MFSDLPIVNDIPLDVRVSIAQIVVVIAVVFVLWLVRHAIAGVVYKPIRALVDSTDTDVDDRILRAINGVSSYIVLALGTFIGALILTSAGSATRNFLFNVTFTLTAIAIFKALYGLGTEVTSSAERLHTFTRIDVQRAMLPVIRIALKALLLVMGFLTIVQIWGISVAGILAGIGLGGLAISLAAKELLDDVLGFLTIVGDDIYIVGEYVISPHGEGIVEQIGLRSTRIRQLNQGLTVVPNSNIANDSVTNWSRLQKRWFNFMIGVTYQSSVEQIQKFVAMTRRMLEGRDHIEDDSIVVLFTEYDDSALNVLVRCYVNIEDWTEAKEERHAVNLLIMQIVDRLDMSIAYPTRSLFVEDVPVLTDNDEISIARRDAIAAHAQDGQRKQSQTNNSGGNGRHKDQASYKGGQDADIHTVEDQAEDGDGGDGE